MTSSSAQVRKSDLEREVARLEKKVKWYAENQQLLDKDQAIIRQKDEEIKRLKNKVSLLSSEVG